MPINTKGNTNSTIKAETTNPLPFCTLTLFSHYRHITKHYTNLSYILEPKHYKLLAFLTYIIKPDNSFIYSIHLHEQYNTSVKFALEHYFPDGRSIKPGSGHSGVSLPTFRKLFKYLIHTAIAIPVSKSLFIINPMVSYHSSVFSHDQYQRFQTAYNNCSTNQELIRCCRGYYLEAVTDSRPLSLNTKKAKSIRAEVSKSSISKHTQNNNTPLHQTPNKQTIHDTKSITPTPITSTTTFQNMPTIN